MSKNHDQYEDFFEKKAEELNMHHVSESVPYEQNENETGRMPTLEEITNLLESKNIAEHFFGDDNEYSVKTVVSMKSHRWESKTEINPRPSEFFANEINIDHEKKDPEKFMKKVSADHLKECEKIKALIADKKAHHNFRNNGLFVLAIVAAAVVLSYMLWILIPKSDTTSTPPHIPDPTISPTKTPTSTPATATPVIELGKVIAEIETGRFDMAREILDGYPPNHEEVRPFLNKLNSPMVLKVLLQWEKGEMTSKPYPSDASQIKSLSLTRTDNYRIIAKTPEGDGTLFMYIFQVDDSGDLTMLLPDPTLSGLDSPAVAHDREYSIPEDVSKWLYLSQIPENTKKPFFESIYVIASPWESKDVEKKYDAVKKEHDATVRKKLVSDFITSVELRMDANFPAIFYDNFSFKHE